MKKQVSDREEAFNEATKAAAGAAEQANMKISSIEEALKGMQDGKQAEVEKSIKLQGD